MASQNWLVLFSLTRLHFSSSEGAAKQNIDTENLIQYLYLLISVAFAIV